LDLPDWHSATGGWVKRQQRFAVGGMVEADVALRRRIDSGWD
jgi:hypothetical protein